MNLPKTIVIKGTKLWLMGAMLPFILTCCAKGGDRSVHHGTASYSAAEIFKNDAKAKALAIAAGSGDIAEISRQIAAGASINAIGQQDITPLWWAAWAGSIEGFSACLDKGADPNAQRAQGQPIMHLIVSITEDVGFLKAALAHGGNPNLRDSLSGETPLFRAILLDHKEQIAILIKAGADLNVQKAVDGWTLPMSAIAANGDYKLVYELLQSGSDCTLKTTQGKSLANIIESTAIAPDDDAYLWREKVMAFLRSKGIKVQRPAHETPRSGSSK